MKINTYNTLILSLGIFLIICMSNTLLFAQSNSNQNPTIKTILERVEKLEQEQISPKSFQNEKKELELNFKELANDLKEEYDLAKTIGLFGFGLTIFGIITLWWRMKNIAEEQAKKYYEKTFKERQSNFIKMVDEHHKTKHLKLNKKILVISNPNADTLFLRQFFNHFEFDEVRFENVEEYRKPDDWKEINLIFANNETGDLDKEIIDSFFENSHRSTALYYYNITNERYVNENISDRLNFANSRIQIYGNLINTLKYHDLLVSK